MENKKIKVSLHSSGSIWLVALLVAALTLILYIPALQNDFVDWDDYGFVYENKYIISIDFEFLKWIFTNQETQWSPLRWLSHAIDYKIWGLNPMGHHLSSIILHGLNTFLVVVLIAGIFGIAKSKKIPPPIPEEDREFWRKAFIASVMTGLLFGIHPLRVESVAWVSERKDVLYAFFFLFSLIFYLKYASSSHNKKRKYYYLFCLLSFIMALMSKAMAVTLPFVLLILDIYPLKRINFGSAFSNPPESPHTPLWKRGAGGDFKGGRGEIKVLIEKLPFLGLSLASALITVRVHEEMGAIKSLVTSTLTGRILVAFKSLSFYLHKIVWPANLAPFHPYPTEVSFSNFDYVVPFILIVAITIICIYSWYKGKRIWLAAWTYFIITLLPVLGIIRVGAYFAAERYTYIPSIGPFLLIGLGISLIWEKACFKDSAFFLNKKLIIITSILILSLLSVLTVKQIKIWSDSITLWTHELKIYPDSAFAHSARGDAYANLGDNQQAIKDHTKAIELNPEFAKAYNNRGNAYYALENNQQAIKDFSRAIELNPEGAEAYNNRGVVHEKLGSRQQAIKDFNRAIELNPKDAEAYNNRGKIYYALEDNQQAIKDFSRAIELNPEGTEAYNNRGVVHEKLGSRQQAIKDFSRAIELNPKDAKAYNNRGNAYTDLGYNQQAIKDFNRAIELNPDDAKAYNNRGISYGALGNYQQAIKDFSRAIELNPEGAKAYNNRGISYGALGNYQQAIKDFSRAIELNPEGADVYNNRGLAYQSLGRYPEAVTDYDKAINLNPEDYKAYYNRGISYRHMGENQKAIKDLSKVVELSPEYLDAYINRGVGYGELGKFENSIKDFNKAIELNPNDATAYYNRGAAYYRLGKEKDAIRDFQKAARLGDKKIQEILKKRGIKW